MWLFLSVWTFNFICTLTALLMVWVYEIAAPVSWVLVVPSLACDIWRLATPDDYAKDGPHHPIWHNPNTVLWIFGGICIAILVVAPFLRFSCFPMINGFFEPYFVVASRKLDSAGGICAKTYSNLVYFYFIIFPVSTIFCVMYITFLCKRSTEFIFKFRVFTPSRGSIPKIQAIILINIFAHSIGPFLRFMSLDHVGSRSFVPVESLLFFAMLMGFTLFTVYFISIGCTFFCYTQSKTEKIHDNPIE